MSTQNTPPGLPNPPISQRTSHRANEEYSRTQVQRAQAQGGMPRQTGFPSASNTPGLLQYPRLFQQSPATVQYNPPSFNTTPRPSQGLASGSPVTAQSNPYIQRALVTPPMGQAVNGQFHIAPRQPSANYRGNTSNPRNHSAAIPVCESSSLFVTQLPPNTTVELLLNTICDRFPGLNDRIYGCSIQAPQPEKGYHHAAASITTFTRPGAERLMHFINVSPGLVINGQAARCIWNRTLAEPPAKRVAPDHSRVLLMRGSQQALFDVIERLCPLLGRENGGVRFETQDAGFWQNGDECVLELIFGSYRGQAANVKGLINKEMPFVDVRYGIDPCDNRSRKV
ncbi:hypothetical protein B0T21DRAFT_346792 [Apiosordaria backusii]|uniref:Uncharacterized protein n=1 Tax=Apiosordaria backusii TaxID=314023 RepID=A0AA40BSH3_9PEZI|nr:hypothetical protein B0T21DRAFT_346792 [Apiosordaria backusii]